MPYLNLDLDWFGHRKAVRLVGLLGLGADLYPVKLWAYVGKHHPETGRLDGYTGKEIESICGWPGEPGKLIETMMLPQINLLEQHENFFQVHDWIEHSGHLAVFKKRAKTAAKKRWARYASSIAKREAKQSSSRGMVRYSKEGKEDRKEGGPGEGNLLPDWLDRETWENFVEYRKKIHAPLSEKGQKLGIAKLTALRNDGEDPKAVIEQTIFSGKWTGLFPVKRERQTDGERLSLRIAQTLRRGL